MKQRERAKKKWKKIVKINRKAIRKPINKQTMKLNNFSRKNGFFSGFVLEKKTLFFSKLPNSTKSFI